jgi:CelD/BcsL family acetyltransferase involved in cellulose biosynthesis
MYDCIILYIFILYFRYEAVLTWFSLSVPRTILLDKLTIIVQTKDKQSKKSFRTAWRFFETSGSVYPTTVRIMCEDVSLKNFKKLGTQQALRLWEYKDVSMQFTSN